MKITNELNIVAEIQTEPFYGGLISFSLMVHFVGENNFEIVQYCLDRGIDINGHGGTALLTAISGKNLEMAKFLIDRGADIKLVANTLLAVFENYIKPPEVEVINFIKNEMNKLDN